MNSQPESPSHNSSDSPSDSPADSRTHSQAHSQAHIHLFDLIAPVYGWFFPMQVRQYRQRVEAHARLFADCRSVLDIGCGTGALVRVLAERGHPVTGLDGSARMLAEARRRNAGIPAIFRQGDALGLIAGTRGSPERPSGTRASGRQDSESRSAASEAQADPAERSDLVVASFVLHGLRQPQRITLYHAMRQLARRRVIIMDYNQRRSLLTSLIEWLEGGDYFSFIQVAEAEMRRVFPQVTVIPASSGSSWYVCECAETQAGLSGSGTMPEAAGSRFSTPQAGNRSGRGPLHPD